MTTPSEIRQSASPEVSQSLSETKAWYAVVVFLLLTIFGWIDRQLLALLVEPIKEDLGLLDWQIGLLHGAAFAVFFAIAGLPIGYLADKYSRKKLLLAGSLCWSAMTAVCGLASTFFGLFAARTGVAVGEATLRPCADSMIADSFPGEKSGLAFAVYTSGIVLGIGIAFVAGAVVIDVLEGLGPLIFPFIGEVAIWQATFIVVGLAGLPVALLTMSIREPKRSSAADEVSLRATVTFIRGNWVIYLAYFLVFSLIVTAGQANHAWGPTFFIRSFGIDQVDAGMNWGIIVIVFSTSGVFAGGYAAKRLAQHGRRSALWDVAMFSQIIAVPIGIAGFSAHDFTLSISLICAFLFFQSFIAPMQPAILMSITPGNFRGQIISITTVAAVIFALTVGPTLVGILNDYLFEERSDIRYSLMAVNFVFPTVGVILLWRFRKAYMGALIS